MSINTLLENPASQSKPWCNLYVDTLTAYKGAKINGNLDVEGDITSDGNIIWPIDIDLSKIEPPPPPLTQFNLLPVATWDGVQAKYNLTWQAPHPEMIAGGANNQVLIRDTDGYGAWSSNVSLQNITSSGNATLNNVTATEVNINGDLRLNSLPGSVGNFIKKTSANSQSWVALQPTDITSGPAHNILVTNSTGTAAMWSNTIYPTTIVFHNSGATFNSFLRVRLDNQTVLYNGAIITSNNSKSLQKTQQLVSMIFFDFSYTVVTPGFPFVSGAGDIPVDYRPASDIAFCIPIRNNNIREIGKLTVSAAGTLTLTPYSSAGFNAGICGTDGNINVSWSIPN